uniref:CSON003182 protein n=1 Tax=Culicoides sonorensis TaxID=179676 RepID=A0A336LSH8_CULSO
MDPELGPIYCLFDELLELIFIQLPPKELLNCRLVCKRWDFILRSTKLLLNSMGIHLEVDGKPPVDIQHPMVNALRSNPALKINRITLNADLFIEESGLPKAAQLRSYLKSFGPLNTVKELTFKISQSQSETMFDLIFICLSALKEVKLVRLAFDAAHGNVMTGGREVKFDKRWSHVCWVTIEEIHFTGFDFWSPGTFTNFGYLLNKMPGLKVIWGMNAFNEVFYEQHADKIKSTNVFTMELEAIMTLMHGVSLKKLDIDGSLHENSPEQWIFLNENQPELMEIRLTFDHLHIHDPILGPSLNLAQNNYEKVKDLTLNLYVAGLNGVEFHSTLIQFQKIEILSIDLLVDGPCFFGHESINLENLEKVYFNASNTNNQPLSCDQCIKSLIKTIGTANTISFEMPVQFEILARLKNSAPQLEHLIIHRLSDLKYSYEHWPLMSMLQSIVVPLRQASKKAEILNFCKACPNLKNIEFLCVDTLKHWQMNIFLQNLEFLETLHLGNKKFVVKTKNENRAFVRIDD